MKDPRKMNWIIAVLKKQELKRNFTVNSNLYLLITPNQNSIETV